MILFIVCAIYDECAQTLNAISSHRGPSIEETERALSAAIEAGWPHVVAEEHGVVIGSCYLRALSRDEEGYRGFVYLSAPNLALAELEPSYRVARISVWMAKEGRRRRIAGWLRIIAHFQKDF